MTKVSLALILAVSVFFLPAVYAYDYIFDTPGQTVIYEGQFIKDGKSVPFEKTLTILDPAKCGDGRFHVVHHAIIKSDTFQDEKVLFYTIKEDGIYLAATAKSPESEIKELDALSMELPLPPEKGLKWQRTRIEGSNLTELELEIMSIEDSIEIAGKVESGIQIKATGSVLTSGRKMKIEKKIFLSHEGRVWQTSIKYLSNGDQSISQFRMRGVKDIAVSTDPENQAAEVTGETKQEEKPTAEE